VRQGLDGQIVGVPGCLPTNQTAQKKKDEIVGDGLFYWYGSHLGRSAKRN
jgi:hypothetical protein